VVVGEIDGRFDRLCVERHARRIAGAVVAPAHAEREARLFLVEVRAADDARHRRTRQRVGEVVRERQRAGELVIALGRARPCGVERIRPRERRLTTDPNIDAAPRDQIIVGAERGEDVVELHRSLAFSGSGFAKLFGSQSSSRGIGVPGL